MKSTISTALIVLASLTMTSHAEPTVFENNNPDLTIGVVSMYGPNITQVLDITQDAWNQPVPQLDVIPDDTFYFLSLDAGSSSGNDEIWVRSRSSGSAEIAAGDDILITHSQHGKQFFKTPPLVVEPGHIIDDSTSFSSLRDERVIWMTLTTEPTPYFIPTSKFVVPVKIVIDSATHFGFIEVENETPNSFEGSWNIARWGYETVPGAPFAVPSSCPADLTADGFLDFFDVSAFLNDFADQDPTADFNADGQFDFFDVSAFLAAFAAGCP